MLVWHGFLVVSIIILIASRVPSWLDCCLVVLSMDVWQLIVCLIGRRQWLSLCVCPVCHAALFFFSTCEP
jgi:hypothetical protein